MYYAIRNNAIEKINQQEFLELDDTICVLSREEWEKAELPNTTFMLHREHNRIHSCKVEEYDNYLYGTYRIPAKTTADTECAFSFYLLREKIVLIDQDGVVATQITALENRQHSNYTLERFFFDFMINFLDDDLFFLQDLEQTISTMEEEVLNGNWEDFNARMLVVKKKISLFFRYYSQVVDLGQELMENEMDFFKKSDLKLLDKLTGRAMRLAGETQSLREYAMQVQDVYQSEISIKQNEVMRTLTVVTTIFLPLSLIAGWYGMNFVNMPELKSQYGYLYIIVASILVVIFCLYIFRKKKFW